MAEAAVKPLVSIVVPVYNVEQYLSECLESLILQTYRNIEIVCVDDGSSDSSPLILQSYAAEDDRIRVIKQENGGVSRARNHGLEVACGDYVLFVDSDDYIALSTCEVLVGAALRDNADIVVFGGKTFPTVMWKDNSFARRNTVYPSGKTVDALVFEPGSRPLMCNKMYSRALLESCGARFNEEISLGEDNAFQFYVFPHAKTVSYVADVLYFYRSREESLVGTTDEDFDEKSRKHMNLVEYIVGTWREMGMLAERPNDMLSWIADFLYDSVRFTSFDVRCEISERLSSIVSRDFDERTIGFIDAALRRKLTFMTESHVAANEPPLVTFVVLSSIGETLEAEALQSILWQDEQRIACVVASDCLGDDVKAIVDKDRRCRIADEITIGSVVESCASRYVVPASCNCRFDTRFVTEAVDFADYLGLSEATGGNLDDGWRDTTSLGSCALDFDVFAFQDHSQSMRCEDAFADCEPDNTQPFRGTSVLEFENIRTRGFCALSLGFGNKMFSVDFLARCIDETPAFAETPLFAWPSLVAKQARTVVVMRVPLVNYAELVLDEEESHADSADERLRAHLDELASCGESFDDAMRPGYHAALAQYCLALDDAIRDFGLYESVRGELAACVKRSQELAGDTPLFLNAVDEEQAQSLLKDDVLVHYERKTKLFLRRMQDINAGLLFEMSQLRDENERAISRIGLFYKSASYRVGQAVTLPARKLYYFAKKLRGR